MGRRGRGKGRGLTRGGALMAWLSPILENNSHDCVPGCGLDPYPFIFNLPPSSLPPPSSSPHHHYHFNYHHNHNHSNHNLQQPRTSAQSHTETVPQTQFIDSVMDILVQFSCGTCLGLRSPRRLLPATRGHWVACEKELAVRGQHSTFLAANATGCVGRRGKGRGRRGRGMLDFLSF